MTIYAISTTQQELTDRVSGGAVNSIRVRVFGNI